MPSIVLLQTSHETPLWITGDGTADDADEVLPVCVEVEVMGSDDVLKIPVISEDSGRGIHGTGRRGMGTYDSEFGDGVGFIWCGPITLKQNPGLAALWQASHYEKKKTFISISPARKQVISTHHNDMAIIAGIPRPLTMLNA